MSYLPNLDTTRLRLRNFKPEDAAEVQALAGDLRIADTTLRVPHPYEDGMAEEFITYLAEVRAKGKEAVFAIERKEDGIFLGAIGLAYIENGEAELGYWIGVPYWNRGYATEAGLAILRYAFFDLGLKRVHANHFQRNPASGRVLQKLGMKLDPTAPTHVTKGGHWEAVWSYEIKVPGLS